MVQGAGTGPSTLSEDAAVWLTLPLTPVKVSGYVPGGVVGPRPMFSVDDPGPLTDKGVMLEDEPEGSPVTERLTGLENPLVVAMLIPMFVLPKANRALAVGLAEMKKSGEAESTNATGVE